MYRNHITHFFNPHNAEASPLLEPECNLIIFILFLFTQFCLVVFHSYFASLFTKYFFSACNWIFAFCNFWHFQMLRIQVFFFIFDISCRIFAWSLLLLVLCMYLLLVYWILFVHIFISVYFGTCAKMHCVVSLNFYLFCFLRDFCPTFFVCVWNSSPHLLWIWINYWQFSIHSAFGSTRTTKSSSHELSLRFTSDVFCFECQCREKENLTQSGGSGEAVCRFSANEWQRSLSRCLLHSLSIVLPNDLSFTNISCTLAIVGEDARSEQIRSSVGEKSRTCDYSKAQSGHCVSSQFVRRWRKYFDGSGKLSCISISSQSVYNWL